MRRKKVRNTRSLKINEAEIGLLDKVTYLGVTLKNRLTWEGHITNKLNKAKAMLSQLRSTTGCSGGHHQK